MKDFFRFLTYHNAVPVALGALFLSVGGALAASPEAREGVADALVGAREEIRSVDNSYIANMNLDSFAPKIQITNVSEDDEHYFVSYTLATVDIVDYVWRDVTKEITLRVFKNDLGERDLGLYVAKQLKDVADRELERLAEVQKIERGRGITRKVVATAYTGLIGKFLDPKEETLPGYVPVKPPEPKPDPEENRRSEEARRAAAERGTNAPAGSSAPAPSAGEGSGSGDTEPPAITLVGNNPARVPLGATFSDPGATVSDNVSGNIGITATGTVDTTVAGEYVITYSATDQAGNTGVATRTVIVEAPATPGSGETTTSTASEEPASDPAGDTSTDPLPAQNPSEENEFSGEDSSEGESFSTPPGP